MPAVDYGSEALVLLRKSLGIKTTWTADAAVHWSFWGTLQRAWSAPVLRTAPRSAWRVNLRTRLFDGFDGSAAQMSAISSCLPHASLAAVAQREACPDHLELASAVDVHDDNVGQVVRVLTVAARAQASEARYFLTGSKTLAAVGLTPVVDTAAGLPTAALYAGEALLRDTLSRGASLRSKEEMSQCVESLRQQHGVRAVHTPWGVSATFGRCGAVDVRSILEVKPDGGRPLLGRGVSVALWSPVRGGPQDALLWNRRELASEGSCYALGGWWAPEGGFLVHRSFYPAGVWNADLVARFLEAYALRAHQANAVAAARSD
jgi:hypothetical protein